MLLKIEIDSREHEFDVLPLRDDEENKYFFLIKLTRNGAFMLAEKNPLDGSWINHSRHQFAQPLKMEIFKKIEETGLLKILQKVQAIGILEKEYLETL